jgi:hypothetical protein
MEKSRRFALSPMMNPSALSNYTQITKWDWKTVGSASDDLKPSVEFGSNKPYLEVFERGDDAKH